MSTDDPTNTPSNPLNPPGTPGSADDAGAATPPSGSRPERDLIREAIEQGTPRQGAVLFADDLPPENAFPNYEVIREIHRGGQGVVYQAIQKTTKRKVAIKVLHGGPFTGAHGRARFEREVQVLGQLNHPNIVRIHDSGITTDGGFFYVMDYISGRTLDEVISDRKLSVDEVITLFTKICDAVNAAHLKGVIHRDLKPANVRVDANGEPIVVDFGLAKISGPDAIDSGHKTPQLMTLTGQFIGSLPWASPEQAEGVPGNIDVRTDVYSLGVMLYQMLTGQFPYRVVGAMRDVLDNILRAEPARPSTIRRQINDEVETIVLKCLSKERERRYQSAGELARDLRRYVAGQPIEAKRDSAGYVIAKTLARYRPWVIAACVGLLGIVGVSIVTTVLWRRAQAAEERTRAALLEAQSAEQRAQDQATRAQQNFLAGHAMAMSMITRIEPELEDLRGATKARELLLQQAKDYLDRLKSEAGDEPSLLLDLASAHEQVADLQGGLYFFPKTGQGDSSDVHLAKAKQIREALLQRLPSDPRVHAAIARTRVREANTLRGKNDLKAARELYAASIDEYDRAMALAGTDQSFVADIARWKESRAWGLSFLGDVLTDLGTDAMDSASPGSEAAARELITSAEDRYASARDYWSARLLSNASDADAARALGVIEDQKTQAAIARARSLFTSGKHALQRANDTDAAIVRFNQGVENYDAAKAKAARAVDNFETQTKAHPESGELRRDLWISVRSLGRACSGQAECFDQLAMLTEPDANKAKAIAAHRDALQHFTRAASIASSLAGSDAASITALRDYSVCLINVGDEQRALAAFDDAIKTYQQALDLRDASLKSDPTDRNTLDAGVAYYKLGLAALQSAKAGGPNRSARLDQAQQMLSRSLQIFKDLRDRGALPAGNNNETEVGGLLEEVQRLRSGPG